MDIDKVKAASKKIKMESKKKLNLSEVFPQIYLSSCPGKVLSKGRDNKKHERNLKEDITDIKEAGILRIICLLNDFELRTLGVKPQEYKQICVEKEVEFIQYSMIEMRPPEEPCEIFYTNFLQPLLSNPQPTLIHCRGGIGRSGLLASCMISFFTSDTKMKFKDIVASLRKSRDKRCIESAKQMDFAKAFHFFIRSHSST